MEDLYYGVKKVDEKEIGINEIADRNNLSNQSNIEAIVCPKCERGLKILENPELSS